MEVKIVSVELEELRKLIEELIEAKFRTFQTVSITDPANQFLTMTEAVSFLHLSKPTLNKLRHNGKIATTHSSDKRVLFKKSDLIAYLNSCKPHHSASKDNL
jgi:excisionase family DNA binding protein